MADIKFSFTDEFEEVLRPLIKKIESLESKILKTTPQRYYRNKDLKEIFGLSDNTIISYRKQNIIPYKVLGEIYYYPIDELNKVLEQNTNCPRDG